MKKLITLLSLQMLVLSAFAQNVITGYVYNDLNKNNKKDRNEKGIANVSVSNGYDVVLTDANGKYTINVGNDNIVFAIKPSGYKFPLDSYNIPKFFYRYKPSGSPSNLKYQGVAPTGNIPSSVDFPMYTNNESDNFTVLVFGDPQPYNMKEMNYFTESIIKGVKNPGQFAFGISLGDLVGDDLTLHEPYKQTISTLNLPWYNVMGNHDMNYDVTTDSLSDESFEKHFGPNTYSFNYGNAHFIILDDIIYPHPVTGKGYQGGFRKSQLDFIENNLKHVDKNKLIVISYHIPIDNEEGGSEFFRDADRQRFFSILKDYPNILMMSAHTHIQEQLYYTAKHGWQGAKPLHEYNVGTPCGDWYSGVIGPKGYPVATMRDGTPRGYAQLNIKNNQYDIDYQVMDMPKEYQIELFMPKIVSKTKYRSALLFANFFMGHKDDVVEFRVDNGDWKSMRYTSSIDPNYFNTLMEWDLADTLLTGRRPSNAVQSKHLWYASLPNNVSIGTHTVEVRATDKYGKTHTAKRTFQALEEK